MPQEQPKPTDVGISTHQNEGTEGEKEWTVARRRKGKETTNPKDHRETPEQGKSALNNAGQSNVPENGKVETQKVVNPLPPND